MDSKLKTSAHQAGAVNVLRQNVRGQPRRYPTSRRFGPGTRRIHPRPRREAGLRAPAAVERLTRRVEWKLIEMPLPRLQALGATADPFIYDIA